MKTRIELLAFAVNMYRQHLESPIHAKILYVPKELQKSLLQSGGYSFAEILVVEELPLKLVYQSVTYLWKHYTGNAYSKEQRHAAFMELKNIIEKLPVKTIPLKEVLQCPDR